MNYDSVHKLSCNISSHYSAHSEIDKPDIEAVVGTDALSIDSEEEWFDLDDFLEEFYNTADNNTVVVDGVVLPEAEVLPLEDIGNDYSTVNNHVPYSLDGYCNDLLVRIEPFAFGLVVVLGVVVG